MELDTSQLIQLVELFKRPPGQRASKLEGRSPASRGSIKDIGPVVIKTYTRGGMINLITKYRYLRTGTPRCQREFEVMRSVRKLGVSVPKPIAFAYRGRVSYSCWLATEEVNEPLNLAELCRADEDRCCKAITQLAEQIRILINKQVLHVDLHPGNVLIDRNDRIYIVDFDRAEVKNWSKSKMKGYYRTRWTRSVDKHKLPSLLREEFSANLTNSPPVR